MRMMFFKTIFKCYMFVARFEQAECVVFPLPVDTTHHAPLPRGRLMGRWLSRLGSLGPTFYGVFSFFSLGVGWGEEDQAFGLVVHFGIG